VISSYSCSGEHWPTTLKASCGIGTICHEFTHCLGLPDLYPTVKNAGDIVIDEWDLMDGGNFTNYGWCPPCYTPLEKMLLGWAEPVELTEPASIKDLKPSADGGAFYRIKHSDSEWLLLENRQQKGWDAELPGNGLLILHVDYDENVWFQNEVNSTLKQKVLSGNDHQRCTIFHADNSTKKEANDLYPFGENNSLTAISSPAATLYNKNVDGTRNMGKSITAITQNNDGTISFVIGPQQFVKDGITTPRIPSRHPQSSAIYSLDGRYLGNDLQRLKSGLYIVGGKKVVK
jgi:hypothetical protein